MKGLGGICHLFPDELFVPELFQSATCATGTFAVGCFIVEFIKPYSTVCVSNQFNSFSRTALSYKVKSECSKDPLTHAPSELDL